MVFIIANASRILQTKKRLKEQKKDLKKQSVKQHHLQVNLKKVDLQERVTQSQSVPYEKSQL